MGTLRDDSDRDESVRQSKYISLLRELGE